MPNKDDTQQTTNSSGQQIAQLVAAIRSLEDRVIGLEPRIANVEEIIVARLNTTRPFEQEILARLSELVTIVGVVREEQVTMREEQAAMHREITALREDFDRFRAETNHNFKLINQKLEHLNNDFLNIRAEHTLLEKRVSRLEERAA
jgi:chromosome segregation ATPase